MPVETHLPNGKGSADGPGGATGIQLYLIRGSAGFHQGLSSSFIGLAKQLGERLRRWFLSVQGETGPTGPGCPAG